MIKVKISGRYIYNLFLTLDQSLNTLLGGSADESISGRLGRAVESGTPKRGVKTAAKVVDWLALKLFKQDDHCVSSIEPEDNAAGDESWSWIKKP